MTHDEIAHKMGKWLIRHPQNMVIPNCPITAVDMYTLERERPDVIGWCSGSSVMIEVKTSRQDFLKDKKKLTRKDPIQGVGHYRIYCCPHGLISENELPDNWGLVYFDKKPEIIKAPQWQQANLISERNMLYSILRRQL